MACPKGQAILIGLGRLVLFRRRPVAVEARRDAVGYVDEGNRRRGEVGRVEDGEVGRIRVPVDDIAHQPAIAFERIVTARNEDEFAGYASGAEIVDLACAGIEIVLEQFRLVEDFEPVFFRQGHGEGIAVFLAGEALVGTREFLRRGVERRAVDLPGDRVNGPAFERDCVGIRPVLAVGEHAVVDADIHDHFARRVLIGIAGMEDVARLDIAPDDLVIGAMARHQADAGLVRRIPAIGEGMAGEQRLQREGDGQVHDDDILLCDGAIVDRRTMLDRDGFLADHLAAGIDDGVMDGRRVHREIGDGMHLAGLWIEVRVGGEGAFQRAAERVVRQRVEFVVQAYGECARLDKGPGIASMPDNVRVGIILRTAARAGGRCLIKSGGHGIGADPAVAIPKRLALLQAYAVNHAVAAEPVVGGRVGWADRIRPDAQVAPVERGGDFTGDLQVFQCQLAVQRFVDAGEKGVLGSREARPRAIERNDFHDALRDTVADRGFDWTGHGKTPGLKLRTIMFTALT